MSATTGRWNTLSPVTAALVIAAGLCDVVFERSRIRSWPGEHVTFVPFRDGRRTPLGSFSGWAATGFWMAAMVSIGAQGSSWLWIAACCALLTVPGLILVGAHNRRVVAEHETRLPT